MIFDHTLNHSSVNMQGRKEYLMLGRCIGDIARAVPDEAYVSNQSVLLVITTFLRALVGHHPRCLSFSGV